MILIGIVRYCRMNGLCAEFSTRAQVGLERLQSQMARLGWWTLLGMIYWIVLHSHLSWILHIPTLPTSLDILILVNKETPPHTSRSPTINNNNNKTKRCSICPQIITPLIIQYRTPVLIPKLRFQINILSPFKPIRSICTKEGVVLGLESMKIGSARWSNSHRISPCPWLAFHKIPDLALR